MDMDTLARVFAGPTVVEVTKLRLGDRFTFDPDVRVPKYEAVTRPRPDTKRVTLPGAGEQVTIKTERSYAERCETDRSMTHLTTDRGTYCVHKETRVTLL